MPFYIFLCPEGHKDRRLLDRSDLKVVQICQCGEEMVRQRGSPGVSKVEVLDNGVMARAIERPADAEALNHARAESHKRFADRRGLPGETD
jgi:hypothetical protein